MAEILVLYYSRHGSVADMARHVARGVEAVDGVTARLRTVPPVTTDHAARGQEVPDDGPPYAELQDLRDCQGLVLGSPTRFGNMAAPMKHFIDSTAALWLSSAMVGKPAGVFTSTGALHGGQESTLLSMMLPLLHHGMLIVGLPHTLPEVAGPQAAGAPYGPTHVAGTAASPLPLTRDEGRLCEVLGSRVAEIAGRLGR